MGDAAQPVKAAAAWVTPSQGGHGAVREAIEHILNARGMLAAGPAHYASVRSKGFEGPPAG